MLLLCRRAEAAFDSDALCPLALGSRNIQRRARLGELPRKEVLWEKNLDTHGTYICFYVCVVHVSAIG